jgi:cyclophilin family peptidyl-prolyl cis-trans isomerase
MKNLFLFTMVCCLLCSCNNRSKKNISGPVETQVLIETNMGNITVKLYNETSKHRANFLKLVRRGIYNGVLFHRVISDFMIQAGDPDSKHASDTTLLGNGSLGYRIPAEFVSKYYHKRGALAAARESDEENPKKESDGSQFYIVTGKVVTSEKLYELVKEKNENRYQAVYDSLKKPLLKEMDKLKKSGNKIALLELQDKIENERDQVLCNEIPFNFTPEQKKIYTTIGGVPHLDGEYTVFGELVSGWDVVDKIQHVKTDKNDRPLKNVVIKKMVLLP